MAEHHFSQPDNGAVVDASVGDVIELGMGESASGGYRWTVASAPTDTVDAAAPTYEFEAGKVGGSSVAHFRFTVKSAGRSAIRLEYKRPWEEGEPPLRTFEMTVEVR